MGEATELDITPVPAPATTDAISANVAVEKELETKADSLEEKMDQTQCEEKTVREVNPPLSLGDDAAPSFVEESYYVKDLKESERKSLQELKAKIEEAIKSNTFLAPLKPVVDANFREVDVKKEEDVATEVETAPMDVKKDEEIRTDSTEAAPMESPVVDVDAKRADDGETAVKDLKVTAIPTPGAAAPTAIPETEATSRDIPIPEEDDSPPLEDLDIWGVPLLHSKGDERTNVVLLKFLRARDFKVNDAMTMLKNTIMWRKEFEADNLCDEEISPEFDAVAYMHGLDKEGHPVCYNHYGVFQDKELYQKTFGNEAQFKKFLRWRIQMLEKSIKKLDFNPSGVHSMLQVTDFKDSPGFVKRRNITKVVLALLQDNYPELVAKQIFINVPWYFGALYSLHGKIATQRSKSKVVVARPDKVTETLFKYISADNVPLRYGGLSRPNDKEFEDTEALVKEMIVKAGEKQTIEIDVTEAGSIVVWDMVVVGWEVVYGEEFVPSAEGAYTVIIQKAKKVAATEEPVRNSFKVTEPGKVILTIDNSSSRRKRVTVHRHLIKKEDVA